MVTTGIGCDVIIDHPFGVEAALKALPDRAAIQCKRKWDGGNRLFQRVYHKA